MDKVGKQMKQNNLLSLEEIEWFDNKNIISVYFNQNLFYF